MKTRYFEEKKHAFSEWKYSARFNEKYLLAWEGKNYYIKLHANVILVDKNIFWEKSQIRFWDCVFPQRKKIRVFSKKKNVINVFKYIKVDIRRLCLYF